jgi:hypothetical protein
MADGAKTKTEVKTTEKNGSQVMLDVLQKNGVDICWGYPGGGDSAFLRRSAFVKDQTYSRAP